MNALAAWIPLPEWEPLLRALLHTLWIGMLAGGALFIALRQVSVKRPALRYGLAVAMLAATVMGGVLAWAVEAYTPPAKNMKAAASLKAKAQTREASERSLDFGSQQSAPEVKAEPHTPQTSSPEMASASTRPSINWDTYLGAAWMLGVALMLMRTVRQVCGAGRLMSSSCEAANPALLSLLEDLRLLIVPTRRIGLYLTDAILVPAVIGAFRPLILLPASTLSGISPDLLKAILAHELAHIRRHDYLVNLCQMAIESLLFFNPCVWWISRQIRIEREACCDALAARVTGGERDYAHVLAEAATIFNEAQTPWAMAAFADPGQSFTLLNRIRRLLLPGEHPGLRLPVYGVVFTFGVVLTRAETSHLSSMLTEGERRRGPDRILAFLGGNRAARLADVNRCGTRQAGARR